MATVTANFGTNTALVVTNLQSLADDALWQSANISNDTVLGTWYEFFVTIGTTTTAGNALEGMDIGIAGSTDGGTDHAGGASGTEGSYTDTANQFRNLSPKLFMPIDASETTARTFTHHFVLYDPPEDFAVVIRNRSGAALAASGNAVEYRLNKHDSA